MGIHRAFFLSFSCAGSINTVSGCLFLYRSWSGRSTPNKGRNHQPGRPKHLLERERKGAQGLTVRPLTSSRIPAALIFFFFAAYRATSVQRLAALTCLLAFSRGRKGPRKQCLDV